MEDRIEVSKSVEEVYDLLDKSMPRTSSRMAAASFLMSAYDIQTELFKKLTSYATSQGYDYLQETRNIVTNDLKRTGGFLKKGNLELARRVIRNVNNSYLSVPEVLYLTD